MHICVACVCIYMYEQVEDMHAFLQIYLKPNFGTPSRLHAIRARFRNVGLHLHVSNIHQQTQPTLLHQSQGRPLQHQGPGIEDSS